MALDTRITAIAAIAACNTLVDLVDGGSAAGYVEILDGSQPAGADVAIGAQNVLATLTLSDPAFGAAADAAPGGRATAAAIAAQNATGTGTASWFRVYNSDDVAVWDGSIGTSVADMIVPTTSVVTGQPFEITSWTATMPES